MAAADWGALEQTSEMESPKKVWEFTPEKAKTKTPERKKYVNSKVPRPPNKQNAVPKSWIGQLEVVDKPEQYKITQEDLNLSLSSRDHQELQAEVLEMANIPQQAKQELERENNHHKAAVKNAVVFGSHVSQLGPVSLLDFEKSAISVRREKAIALMHAIDERPTQFARQSRVGAHPLIPGNPNDLIIHTKYWQLSESGNGVELRPETAELFKHITDNPDFERHYFGSSSCDFDEDISEELRARRLRVENNTKSIMTTQAYIQCAAFAWLYKAHVMMARAKSSYTPHFITNSVRKTLMSVPHGLRALTRADRDCLNNAIVKFKLRENRNGNCIGCANPMLPYGFASGRCMDCYWQEMDAVRMGSYGIQMIVKAVNSERPGADLHVKGLENPDLKFVMRDRIPCIKMGNNFSSNFRIEKRADAIDAISANPVAMIVVEDMPSSYKKDIATYYEGYYICRVIGNYTCLNVFQGICKSFDEEPETFEEAMFPPGTSFVALSAVKINSDLFCRRCRHAIDVLAAGIGY